MAASAGASCGPWTNPLDLLLDLSALGVHLAVGRDACGQDRICMADPLSVAGLEARDAICFWEEDLVILIRERRLTRDEAQWPPQVPAWVVFRTSRRGNRVLRYPALNGALHQYWQGENRPWRRN